MKKYTFTMWLIICISLLALAGCGNIFEAKKLPIDPEVFQEKEYTNPDNPDDSYVCISYNGRLYVPYGTLGSRIDEDEPNECIGYVKREDAPDDTTIHVFTFSSTDDLLFEYAVGAEMETPMVLRAIDTQGEDIEIPGYVDSLGYEIW